MRRVVQCENIYIYVYVYDVGTIDKSRPTRNIHSNRMRVKETKTEFC